MRSLIKRFVESDAGAVTVDWVILTAGVVGLALAASSVIWDGTEDLSGDLDSQLSSQLVKTTF